MTSKKLNVIIGFMVAFIICFMVGSFAYDNIRTFQSDQAYEESLKDLDDKQQQNASGQTSQERKK